MSEYIVELNSNAVSGGKFLLGSVYLDAEEIVRCRDCKRCMAYAHFAYCDKFAHTLPNDALNGFCAWGVRKGADDD